MADSDKLKMHSPDLTQENIARIRELFPNCVTEARDEKTGKLRLKVDFDLLRQELADHVVEGPTERYRLDWPGKRQALLAANTPIPKTLRPCREESVDFDTTQNLFIEGDNLEALKLLQEAYLGKVKMIYIDPPYNTGKDFVYKDRFAESVDEYLRSSNQKDEEGSRLVSNPETNGRFHSDWLSMMYPRLKLARNLLRDDGVIFISIDDNEVANLRKLCDEIFGEENYIASIMRKRKKEVSNDAKNVAIQGEYIVVYSKSSSAEFLFEPLSKEYIAQSYREPTDEYPEGRWRPVPITVSKGLRGGGYKYSIKTPGGKIHTRTWAYPKEGYERLLSKQRIYFGRDRNGVPQRVIYAHESKGQPTSNYWDDAPTNKEGKKEILSLFGKNVYETPKPSKLIERLIQLVSDSDDIIVDFFAGSCTAAHAVLSVNKEDGRNRRFIMVQLPEPTPEKSEARKAGFETIADIAKERIRRAGKKILEGECHEGWNRDVGFRVLKVDTSNMKDVYYYPHETRQSDLEDLADNIKPGRTAEDLLFQVLIDWGVEPTLPIRRETIQGKEVFFVDENALIACFDRDITEDLIKELARHKPLRAVFRDAGFANDAALINATQIFRQLSPDTDVKVI